MHRIMIALSVSALALAGSTATYARGPSNAAARLRGGHTVARVHAYQAGNTRTLKQNAALARAQATTPQGRREVAAAAAVGLHEHGDLSKGQFAQDARTRFNAADVNNDGKLSPAEAQAARQDARSDVTQHVDAYEDAHASSSSAAN